MVCRALGFAAVLLLVGGGLVRPVQAQENLDAGKSPSQLFAGTCSACHKSPRGLLKTVPAGSLQGFLRQHYTTSPEMAGVLAGYLVSNGASDARTSGGKNARDGKSETRSEAKPETAAPAERAGRRHRRSATEPAASGEAAPAPEAAAGADAEPKPHARHRSAKHRRRKPAGDDAAKPNAASEEPSEAARPAAEEKPAESRAEAPKVEAPKESESPSLRAEPAPSAGLAAPTTTQSIPSTPSAGTSDPTAPAAH